MTTRARKHLAPLIVVILAAAQSCAPTQPGAANTDAPIESQAGFAQILAPAVAREERRPSAPARKAPPPPGLDPALVTPPSPDNPLAPRATMSLEQALEQVDAAFPEAPDLPPIEPNDRERWEAINLYARGRLLRLNGRIDEAIATLEEAARLEPDAPHPWREIGEARLQAGDRRGARIAFSRAFDRDPSDARTLEQMASLPGSDLSDQQSAAILARLLTLDRPGADPALDYIIPAQLGNALLNMGYTTAAIDLLEAAIDLPDQFGRPSNRAPELSALYRRRGDIWATIGDANLRLGRPKPALEAYTRALDFPTLDPSGLLLRRVNATMAQGRPAAAAKIVLDRMSRDADLANPVLLTALRHIAQHSNLVDPLDRSISALAAELSEAGTPPTSGAVIRARAAILPTERAVEMYRRHLALHPHDESALTGLLERLDDQDPTEALREAIRLTAAAPLSSQSFFNALRTAGHEPAPLLEAWDRLDPSLQQTPAAQLTHARLLLASNKPADADRVLAALLDEAPNDPAAIPLRVLTLELLLRGPEADDIIAALQPENDTPLSIAKATALLQRENPVEALRVAENALEFTEDPLRRTDLLVLAARAAIEATDAPRAESHLREALSLSPSRQDAQAFLAGLYSQRGLMPDQEKLGDLTDELVRSAPTSPIARLLVARDALENGRIDNAQRILLPLAESHPDLDDAVSLLVAIWTQSGALDRAEAWLRRQAERSTHPASIDHQLARVLVAQNKDRRAAEILEARLAIFPGDAETSNLLEQIYEVRLNDESAAIFLRRRRLENAGNALATAAERAELLIALRAFDDFAAAVDQAVEYARTHDLDRSRWATTLVDALYRLSRTGGCPVAIAIDAQRTLCTIETIDPKAHLQRLFTLCVTVPDEQMLLEAFDVAWDANTTERTSWFPAAAATLADPRVVDDIQRARRNTGASRAATSPEQVARLSGSIAMIDAASHKPDTTARVMRVIEACAFHALRGVVEAGASSQIPQVDTLADILEASPNKDAIIDAYFEFTTPGQNTQRALGPRNRSALAGLVAERLSFIGRDTAADDFDELAITVDPDNASSLNNYGYRLLERDDAERLDDAVSMIERAYEATAEEPQAHITDSLGWARYKSGVVHDVVGPDGEIEKRGAIFLLRQALSLSKPAKTWDALINVAILSSHLGDALWAGGDSEEAVESWQTVIESGESVLAETLIQNAGVSVVDELRRTITAAKEKIEAVEQGADPAIAPIHRPINERPDADAPQPAGIISPEPDPG